MRIIICHICVTTIILFTNSCKLTRDTPKINSFRTTKKDLTVEHELFESNQIHTNSKKDLGHLRQWTNKPPINLLDENYQNIFEDPELKAVLIKTLGIKRFEGLSNFYNSFFNIKEIDGFLLIWGVKSKTTPKNPSYDASIIVISPETSQIYVFIIEKGKYKSFSNTKNDKNLPHSIKQIVNAYSVSDKNPNFSNSLDLSGLKKWIAKYPITNNKKYKNFFYEPGLKKILLQILKPKKFIKLIKHFYNSEPIEEKNGFLTMLGSLGKNTAPFFTYAMVAINPKTNETQVFFVNGENLEFYSNASGGGTLSNSAKRNIFVQLYTNLSNSFIGNIKKPPLGFGCYALTHSEWDKNYSNAALRKYVFILTDDSDALVNVNSKDLLLPYIDSKEFFGEKKQQSYIWNFGKKNVSVSLTLNVINKTNEGKHIIYEGLYLFKKGTDQETIPIKATCYE